MPFKDKTRKLEWQKKNRQKKRESQPVETKPEPTQEPATNQEPIEEPQNEELIDVIEPLGPQDEELGDFELNRFPIKNQDCLVFRKMISGDLPRDGLFCDEHDVSCPSCNAWRMNLERGGESSFKEEGGDPFHGDNTNKEPDFGAFPEDHIKNMDMKKDEGLKIHDDWERSQPERESEPTSLETWGDHQKQIDEGSVPEKSEPFDAQGYIEQTFTRKQKENSETQDNNQQDQTDDNNDSDNQ